MEEKDKRIDRIFAQAAIDSADRTHLLLPSLGLQSQVNYAQTYEQAACLAGALQKMGVKAGDRVASFLTNSREVYDFYIACSLLGAIGVALNTLSTSRELKSILADCEPVGLICSESFLDRMQSDTLPDCVQIKIVAHSAKSTTATGWHHYGRLLDSASPAEANVNNQPDDPGFMIYSSGTTGAPKGILLSHKALVDNLILTSKFLGLRPDDRTITLLPLFSSFGFAFDFLQVALLRASVVILPEFTEQVALDAIEQYQLTFLAGVPTMFARMFDPSLTKGRDLSSVRLIDVGGGPVSTRLKRELKSKLGITACESYGMTEISPVASIQHLNDDPNSSSCGPPLPGFKVKILGRDGQTVATGEPGEILLQSPTFMLRYWNKPEQTAAALQNGWLHSGDFGYLDDDGNIHILDRTKDMIVTNGFNVYPKEVENVIAELDEVQMVAVVGVKNEMRGEIIHAFVEPRPGKTIDSERVINHCREYLARYKVPWGVTEIHEVPLTASGKIRRFKLREMASSYKPESAKTEGLLSENLLSE